MSLSSLHCQAGSLPPVPPGKPLSNMQVSLFFLLWLFVLVLCCPEVFLAKQAAVSPEGACADPLRLHTASGSCLRSKGAPEAGPEPSAAARVRTQEDSAREQSLGQSRAAKEVTGRVTASQTGTGGQPLPSSLSWSSWGTLASQPLGFGARRPLGSWPLLLESWSPPPHLMRARLPHPCGERLPHSGGPGQGGGDRRSGGVRKPTRPGAWPWDAGPRDCPQSCQGQGTARGAATKAKGLPAGLPRPRDCPQGAAKAKGLPAGSCDQGQGTALGAAKAKGLPARSCDQSQGTARTELRPAQQLTASGALH